MGFIFQQTDQRQQWTTTMEGNNFGINEYLEVMIQKEPYLLHK
jgi:hypothetical protein